jgi:hypothetical protein
MKLKETVIILATSASFASDLIYHDKNHLHIHIESINPTYAPTGGYVYGTMVNQFNSKVTYTGFATLAIAL